MSNKMKTLNLIEKTGFIPDSPIYIYATPKIFHDKNIDSQSFIKLFLSMDSFLAGDIKVDKGAINFSVIIRNYGLYCMLGDEHRNIIIKAIFENPGSDFKRAYVEGTRKIVYLHTKRKTGVVFKYSETDPKHPEPKPNDDARSFFKEADISPIPFGMDEDSYKALSDFFLEEARTVEKKADHPNFTENFLDVVDAYAEAEYQLEKDNALGAQGISYTSAKSVTRAGGDNKNFIYEFICPNFNEENYPLNTEMMIDLIPRTPGKQETINGNITEIEDLGNSEKKLTISIRYQFDDSRLPKSGGIMRKAPNKVQRRVRKEVVEQFRNNTTNAQYMYTVFDTFKTAGFDDSIDVNPIFEQMKKDGDKLNESQSEAIKKGVQTRDIALIQGPPGTGKTTVIVQWILFYLSQGKRILVSSKNNKAVDNVLERIAKKKHAGILRIGSAEKVQSNVREYLPDNQFNKIQKRIFDSLKITKEKIRDDMRSIDLAQEAASALEALSSDYFAASEHLDGFYNKYAAALKDIKERYVPMIQAKDNLIKNSDRVGMLRIYLEENEKKGFLSRLLHRGATKRIQAEYEQIRPTVEALRKDYIAKAKAYNNKIKELSAIKTDKEFLSEKKHYFAYKTELDNMLQKNTSTISVPLRLPYSFDSYKFDYIRENLSDCIKRLAELRKTVEDFKDTIEGWETNISENDNEVLTNLLIDDVNVVGATCIGINSQRRFAHIDFDITIIDEAGQIQIHDAIVPMSRSNKTLMLGDHRQIPPIVDKKMLDLCRASGVRTDLLEKSLFEFLFEPGRGRRRSGLPSGVKQLLNMQFRMPAEVAEIISNQFYEGKYKSFKEKGLKSKCPNTFKRPLVIIDTSGVKGRFSKYDKNKSQYNPYEAKLIEQVLKSICEKDDASLLSPDNIGIIAPYSGQMNEIRKTVKKAFPTLGTGNVEAMVATLDSFQGQERPIIIYSCTASKEEGSIGFLSELRRFNVALSRCEEQIVIIGDFEFLTNATDDPNAPEDGEMVEETAPAVSADDEDGYDAQDFYDDEDNAEPYGGSIVDTFKKIRSSKHVDMSDLAAYEKQIIKNSRLDGSEVRFNEFMEYLLRKVRDGGSGQYIRAEDWEV